MRRIPAVLVITLALSGSACVGPARTNASYGAKAADTADAVVSAARTVLVAARAAGDGDLFAPTVSVVAADAETDATSARDAFASIQPPDPAADRLRRALLGEVQRAVDVIELVRIAARRAEGDRLVDVAAPLAPLAAQLERLAARHG